MAKQAAALPMPCHESIIHASFISLFMAGVVVQVALVGQGVPQVLVGQEVPEALVVMAHHQSSLVTASSSTENSDMNL